MWKPSENLNHVLVINQALTVPGQTAAEFIINLSHEKAHEDLWQYRQSNTSELGRTEVVFDEFFPMLEEYLAFRKILSSEPEKIPAPIKEHYIDATDEVKTYVGNILGSDTPVRIKSHTVNALLTLAYGHSLYQEKPREQIANVLRLMNEGKDPADIKKALDEFRIKKTPVLNSSDLMLHEEI